MTEGKLDECRAEFEAWWRKEPVSYFDGVTAEHVWRAWQEAWRISQVEPDLGQLCTGCCRTDCICGHSQEEALPSTKQCCENGWTGHDGACKEGDRLMEPSDDDPGGWGAREEQLDAVARGESQ